MAKKKVANMSAECRRWYASHPDDAPQACVEGLAQEGVTVSRNIASHVKYKARHTRATRRRATRRAIRRAAVNLEPGISSLVAVKTFAKEHGGTEGVRQLLDIIDKLDQL